jgi:putative membrane protein
MNRIIQGTLAFTAAACFTGAALAQLSAEDRKFVETAAAESMAEVELGKLAQQKGSNDEVKKFGARIATDHGKASEELKRLAKAKGIDLRADARSHKELEQFTKISPERFDGVFMTHMVRDHKKDVVAFRKQAKEGKDPQVKAFAEKTLPTLEEHLKLAQATQSAVAGAKPARQGTNATEATGNTANLAGGQAPGASKAPTSTPNAPEKGTTK